MTTIDDAQNTREEYHLIDAKNRYEEFKASRGGSDVPLDKSELRRLVKSSIVMFIKFSYDQKIRIATRLDIRENNLIVIQLDGESDQSLPSYHTFNIDKICDLERML